MDYMLQPKDIDWLNGYKNKTRTYAVYKRHLRAKDKQAESKRMEKDTSCKW